MTQPGTEASRALIPTPTSPDGSVGAFLAAWHADADAVQCLSDNLDQLVSACPDATIFNSKEWLLPAARHLLAGRRLMVLTIRTHGTLVGMAPLTWGTEWLAGVPVRTVRYLGHPFSDRIDMLAAPACPSGFDELVNGILTFPEPWDLIVLDEILRSDLDRITAFVTGHRAGTKIRVRHCARSPVLHINKLGAEGLEQQYSRSLRTRLRRARKKQAASGKVEIRHIRGDVDGCDAWVAAIAKVEGASWKGSESVGVFMPGARFDFFSEVTRRLLDKDRLDLWLMYLNERLIAYRWQPRFGGAALDYNFAHLPDLDAMSPGRVLLDETIQAAARDPELDRVDASHGSITRPNLLRDWTADYIDQYAVWLANSTIRGALMHFLATRVNPLVKRFRHRSPPVTEGSG